MCVQSPSDSTIHRTLSLWWSDFFNIFSCNQ